MRILIATYWPLPHIGGVSTYIDTLAAGLEGMGHQVEVLGQLPDLSGYHLRKSGHAMGKSLLADVTEAEIVRGYKEHGVDITPWIAWRETEKYFFGYILHHCALEQYDLIHAQDIVSAFAIANVKPDSVSLVATIHGCLATEWTETGEWRFRTNMEKEYIRLEEYYGSMTPDHLILPSCWLANRLAAFAVAHPRAEVIAYGLGEKKHVELMPGEFRAASGTAPDSTSGVRQKTIVCVARLVAVKGHRYLVQALHLMRQRDAEFVCRLAGDGALRSELEDQVKRLGLQDCVEFLGDVPDVKAVLATADVVVLPSLQDNLPFAVMEAQALGKPVVASAVGGIVEMSQDGIDGFLVPSRDVEQLSAHLSLLLQDEDLRRRMSVRAAQKATERWDARTMLTRTVRVYEEAVRTARAQEDRAKAKAGAKAKTGVEASVPPVPAPEFAASLKQSCPASGAPDDPIPVLETVSGCVRAAVTQQTVGDASVHLLDVTGIVLRSVGTDEHGNFAIGDVPAGTYTLACFSRAHGSRTQKISVPQAADSPFAVLLA